MKELLPDRTPPVIAAEINAIKHQTGKIILAGAIEIGRRLKEAKELLPYGEWGKWLEESVSYSQKTAERLMNIFDAYGAKGEVSLSAGTQEQGQKLMNLNYSQALILLGVPKEERTQFIAELDIESMSARELKKVVSERSQAVKERDQVIQERNQALQEKADLQKALDEQAGQIGQLSTERDSLKANAEGLKNSKAQVEARALVLEKELLSVRKSVKSESVEQLKKDLNAANLQARINKIALLYESMDRAFKDLTWEIKNLAAGDPEAYKVYRKRVKDFLSRCSEQNI